MTDGKAKVLLVDDEENILEAVSLVLEEKFDITTANRGDKALVLYQENSFDLVVSDVRMPGINGLELFREVRRLNPGQKFIFVTVSNFLDDEPEAQEILDRKADGFLAKPYRIPDLLSLIRKVLG